MGARGPHDDFEDAKNVIRASNAEFSLHQDIDAISDAYVTEETEYVSRDGTFFGPEKWESDMRVQLGNFRFELEVEEILDAGGGALLVLNKALRRDKETGEVVWKAWPAVVVRIHNGRYAFFEGYIDRRKAFADYGI